MSTEELQTEVTSIAKEEERTGQKIATPSAEDLLQRAASSYMTNMHHLSGILGKLGKKAKDRAIIAGLSLPMDKLPVRLIKDDEKLAFGVIQRIIADRFIITQYHISQEMQAKLARDKQAKTESDLDSKTKQEGDKNEEIS